MAHTSSSRVFEQLSPAEQDLLIQLLLASGSLKSLAESYGVSYPTIRSRLDRLISRVEELRAGQAEDRLANKLSDLIEGGQLAPTAAREVLELHRSILNSAPAGQESHG